ncbi:MAG TPA: HYR domain-containing protein, partial [Thermoanaerobaculia bacterium]
MKTAKKPDRPRIALWGTFVVFASLLATSNAFSAITIFAADCATPKTAFVLGETVCVAADSLNGLRLAWVDPDGFVVQRTDITADPQSDSFTLPSTAQSSIAGLFVSNNLGSWRITAITTGSSVKTAASFSVRDPANARVDLSVVHSVAGTEQPVAGGSVQYDIALVNLGPDDAVNTRLVDNGFSNVTFGSLTQTSGPAFTCTGADCTIASFPAGAKATFVANFTAGATGGVIENVASVTSDTVEIRPEDNSTAAPQLRVSTVGTPTACRLDCAGNVVVSANTTSGGVAGAIVTLSAPEAFGTCGPVTLSPASGSFFAAGTTTVSATASGGGICSFTVTVIETPPPAIICPSDITVTALSGENEAFVPAPNGVGSDPGTATATGSNVSVIGERSDNRPLSDRYPIGVTTIIWRATDDGGRTVTCAQRIFVTSPDAPTILCPPSRSFIAPTGSCDITVSADDIGIPVTGGLGVTLTSRRSDELALTAAYPAGETFITWTASNALGLVSCVQTIRVRTRGTQIPVLTIPPDITRTTAACFTILDDELGVATAEDNCAVTIVRTGVPPNFVFPTGTTNITYTATDAAGNTATGVQRIQIIETPAIRPTITPPPDVTVNTGATATACGVVVPEATLGTATTGDNCPGVSVSRTGVPTGNFFPVGETLITYVATDASGNSATATQKVTVVDNTPPLITTSDVTVSTGPGATACGVLISDAALGTPSATDNCPGVTTSRSGVPSGNFFPVGETVVTYIATDAAGNTTTVTQKVTVLDTTPPTITCPPSLTLEPTCPAGAVAAWTAPNGADNCAGVTTSQAAGLANGAVFPIGATTTVTYTALDVA